MTVTPPAGANAQSLLDRACEAHEGNRLQDAEKFYRAALAEHANYAEALLGLGMLLRQTGQLEEARQCLARCAACAAQPADAWLELGLVHVGFKDHENAARAFAAAAKSDPSLVGAHMNLGLALANLDRPELALQAMQKAVALEPNNAEIWKNYALAALEADRPDEAYRAAERAAASGLEGSLAAGLLGLASLCAGRYDIAERETRRALEAAPDTPDLTIALGLALEGTGRAEQAIEHYRAYLARQPDQLHARFMLALLLLAQGEFKEAWPQYAVRPSAREHWASLANLGGAGELSGRSVLVHTEQGIGDEIFFLRYVPLLRQVAKPGKIFYSASSRFQSMASRVKTLDGTYIKQEKQPWVGPQILLGDLPLICDDMAPQDALPAPLRIQPLDENLELWRAALAAAGPAPYLAVSWRGGQARRKKGQLLAISQLQLKRVEPKLLGEALRGWPGTVISVQYQPDAADFEAFSNAFGGKVFDASGANENLESLLALLALVDELVGVSSVSVHLRATAGRTARVLIQHPPEWRWMLSGERSPWYPQFPLYRQSIGLDWSEALARLRSDLGL